MKLKIYYDGNPATTRVEDKETGEMLEDVVSVHVDMSAFEAYATIVLAGDVEIDIDNVEVRDEDTEGLYRGAGAGDNSEDLQEAG